MPWYQQLLLAVGYFLAGAPATYTIGKFTITVVDSKGAPVHATWPAIEAAILAVASGQPGTIAVGDISVTVAETAPPAP
jgi:hypothetical protein